MLAFLKRVRMLLVYGVAALGAAIAAYSMYAPSDETAEVSSEIELVPEELTPTEIEE